MVHLSTGPVATRVMVIERLRILRELLTDLLSSEEWVDVTSSVRCLSEANESLQSTEPHIVVVSVPAPDGCAIEWVTQLKQKHPDIRAIFLSSAESDELVLDAVNVGVDGFLAMDSSCISLVDAVRSVAAGDRVYDSSIGLILQRVARQEAATSTLVPREPALELSLREQEIAQLVARGYTNQEIAQQVFVSVNTVKTHLRRIFQRLGISSRRELIVAHRAA